MRLRRAMLVREAPNVPDLTARILAETPVPRGQRWGLRLALALVAFAQCGLGFAELLGADPGHAGHGAMMAMSAHLSNESAAWNLALGIGLAWAALLPATAAGLLPVLTGFVVVLGVVSGIDLSDGQVTAGRLLSHGLVVAGLGLLYAVRRRQARTPAPAPAGRDSVPGYDDVGLSGPAPSVPSEPEPRRRFPHLPASRRAA